jgi:hypothetical protein
MAMMLLPTVDGWERHAEEWRLRATLRAAAKIVIVDVQLVDTEPVLAVIENHV